MNLNYSSQSNVIRREKLIKDLTEYFGAEVTLK